VTVCVDNAQIPATVGRHKSRWSHLTADDVEELHRFAQRLGLRRSHFQTCKATAMCPPATCPHWHYDVTAAKREQALSMGAQPIGIRDWIAIIARRRTASRAADPAHPPGQAMHRRPPGRGYGLQGPACHERAQLDQGGGLQPPQQAMCFRCGRVTARRDTDGMPCCGGAFTPQTAAAPTHHPDAAPEPAQFEAHSQSS